MEMLCIGRPLNIYLIEQPAIAVTCIRCGDLVSLTLNKPDEAKWVGQVKQARKDTLIKRTLELNFRLPRCVNIGANLHDGGQAKG